MSETWKQAQGWMGKCRVPLSEFSDPRSTVSFVALGPVLSPPANTQWLIHWVIFPEVTSPVGVSYASHSSLFPGRHGGYHSYHGGRAEGSVGSFGVSISDPSDRSRYFAGGYRWWETQELKNLYEIVTHQNMFPLTHILFSHSCWRMRWWRWGWFLIPPPSLFYFIFFSLPVPLPHPPIPVHVYHSITCV